MQVTNVWPSHIRYLWEGVYKLTLYNGSKSKDTVSSHKCNEQWSRDSSVTGLENTGGTELL